MASLAKMNHAAKARAIVADARDILGGNGILLEHHVARHHADMEAVFTFEGTDSIQSLIVGREITGIQAIAPAARGRLMAGPEDLDLLAASLRADAGDLDAFVEALAVKLEAALPDQVEVERRGGRLGGRKRVRRIEVTLGDQRYEAEADRGRVTCRRRSVVARDRAEDPGARPRRLDRRPLAGPHRGGGPQRARAPSAGASAGGLMARPFSSALSVAEAFVVREAGFTPIAQVMGSCFYQVGWQSMPWGQLGWTGARCARATRSSSRPRPRRGTTRARSPSAACATRRSPRGPTRSSACA